MSLGSSRHESDVTLNVWRNTAETLFEHTKDQTFVNKNSMFDKLIVDCALKEDLDSTRTSHEGKECKFLPSLTSKGICSTVNGQQTLDIWKPSELTTTFSQLFPNKHVGEVFGGTGRAQGIFLLNRFDIKKK